MKVLDGDLEVGDMNMTIISVMQQRTMSVSTLFARGATSGGMGDE